MGHSEQTEKLHYRAITSKKHTAMGHVAWEKLRGALEDSLGQPGPSADDGMQWKLGIVECHDHYHRMMQQLFMIPSSLQNWKFLPLTHQVLCDYH